MTDTSYQAPKARAMLLGIIAFIMLMLAICFLANLTKLAGETLLFLPAKVGLVERVQREQVQTISMQTSPSTVQIDRHGPFSVYAIDYDLLQITALLETGQADPWLVVTSPSGQPVKVNFVSRGLRPYDCPWAPGRPIFTFQADEPGEYLLVHPRRPTSISLLPDVTSGHEKWIVLIFLLELALVLYILFRLFRKQYQKQTAKIQEVQNLKKIRGDDFWQSEINRRRKL